MSLRSPFTLLAFVLALGAVIDCAAMAEGDDADVETSAGHGRP